MPQLPLMTELIVPLAFLAGAKQTIALVLLILFFVPLLFQIATGLKALKRKIKLKFWMVCLISVLGQVLTTVSLLWLMTYNMRQYKIRDGLGFVFLEFAAAFMIILLLLVMITQWIVNYRRNKINVLR